MSARLRPVPFQSMFVDVGVRMHAASWGEGDTTHVLVHGLGGSHVNWMMAGGALAEGGRVLAPDMPGFGRTDPRGRVSLERMREALDRFLATTCKGPVVLVGHSMGGAIAVLQAAMRPETVKKLVLVAPALPLEPGARVARQTAILFTLWMLPFAGPWLIRKRAAEVGPEGTVRDMMRATVKDLDAVRPEVLEAHVAFARTRPERPWIDAGLAQAARSLIGTMSMRARVHGIMRQIQAPTMIVQGAEDRLVPLSTALAAAKRHPEWRLEIIEGIGHAPPLEVPERFVEIVRGFTAKVGASSGAVAA